MIDVEFYQKIVNDLCIKYNLPFIEVIFDADMLHRKGSGGEYNWKIEKIIVDPLLEQDGYDIREVVTHEFRHYWQRYNYTDIFFWWLGYSNDLYRKYYNTPFCSIEEDARVFGESYGCTNREDLLAFYEVEQLCEMRDDERILHLTLQFLGLE